MKIIYIDPIFGISGDMMLAALIHAGYPFDELIKTLKKMPYPLPEITPEKITHGIIEGLHLNIEQSHIHLTIQEMEKVIEDIDLDEGIKEDARAILHIIVDAESKIHGISKDELHFHELSNIDTLIDIIGVAAGINYMGIDRVYCGPVPCGRGTINTSHGIIPNPPPVTLEILSGMKLVFYDEALELTTPTGAAIVKHFVKGKNTPPSMSIEKTGYGAGTYKASRPDILRIFIGESNDIHQGDDVWVIETDIDDMDMEYIGAVSDRIREAGAIDCLFFPVYMKKGRLGIRLSVIARDEHLENIKDAIFTETTTFGIRLRRDSREVLKREIKKIETSFGPVRVKYGSNSKGDYIKIHIEFDDVKRLAEEMNIPYRTLYDTIKKEIK
ncbi:MAG: nickel pincer cofactor biosynthesis protein LarC [Syntrophorhabdaceae bacterium]|nr:nickel pincer cofactor biosynthesis protein LarC [Syntrophorhabdaceae bacterium]